MKLKDQVLAILADNTHRSMSGQEIAEQLYVTRSGVWKAIEELRQEGYTITAATNRGYLLQKDMDILSEGMIRSGAKNCPLLGQVQIHKVLASTNTTAKQQLLEGCPSGTLVVADTQSNGRGRFGRSFYSPAGTGAYFSLVLKSPALRKYHRGLLTVMGAVAVCAAIEECSSLTPKIKWVNDVMIDGKKVCGILTEGIGDLESDEWEGAVIGFGINMNTEHFEGDLNHKATSLFVKNLSRSWLIGRVIYWFAIYLENYHPQDGRKLIGEYVRRSCILGERVEYHNGEMSGVGQAVEINLQGNLVIELDSGEKLTLRAGEVTLHRQ